MKRVVLFIVLFATVGANAQYIAGGVYGGQQPCGYPVEMGAGASDISDEVIEIRKERAAARKKLSKLKRRQSKEKAYVKKLENAIRKGLSSGAATQVIDHMRTNNARVGLCNGAASAVSDGNPSQLPVGTSDTELANAGGGTPVARSNGASAFCVMKPDCAKDSSPAACQSPEGPYTDFWLNKYGLDGGQVNAEVCASSLPRIAVQSSNANIKEDCRSAIGEYHDRYAELMDVNSEIASLQSELRDKDRELDDAKTRAEEDGEDGEFCATCSRAARGGGGARPSIWQSLLSTALVGGLGYLTYRGVSDSINTNARLGWPTNPGMVLGASYPLLAASLMGGIAGGVGSGGYACAGTIGNPGMNPYGVMNPNGMYGSLYSPMGGAFGYPGSYGMPGIMAGYPNYGMGAGYPGYGMASPYGMQSGLLPYPGGAAGGYAYAGGYAAGGYAYAGGPVPVPGYAGAGGYATGLLPYPGGAGGYPGMGLAMNPYGIAMAQQQAYAAQDYAMRAGTISQLQSQMYQIQAQITAVASGASTGYQLLPYPGGTYGGYQTPYSGYSSYGLSYGAAGGGPVPLPGSTTYSPTTYGTTGTIYGR